MVSTFKIGDFVSINTDSELVGQIIATPDTDYSIRDDYVKVVWYKSDDVPTFELSKNLTKLKSIKVSEK